MIHKVHNLLYLTHRDRINPDEMVQNGVGSIVDFRLRLPEDYIKNERVGLQKAQMYYTLMPLDSGMAGPLSLVEGLGRMIGWDHESLTRVALHENENQNAAAFIATACMMSRGMTPKEAMGCVSNSGAKADMTDEQKSFLNLYGEYLVQRPFVKDQSEIMVLKQQTIQKMQEASPSETKGFHQMAEADFFIRRGFDVKTPKKGGCGCGGH